MELRQQEGKQSDNGDDSSKLKGETSPEGSKLLVSGM